MKNVFNDILQLNKALICTTVLLLIFLTSCAKNDSKPTKTNKINYRRWSMIGCHIADTYSGIKVVSINKNSAAAKGDLRIKDIVLELNDKLGTDTATLIRRIRESLPQTKIKLKINRNGYDKIIFLTTAAYPLEPQLRRMISGANKIRDFTRTLELIKEYERKIPKGSQSKTIIKLKKKLVDTLKIKTI